MPYYRRFRRGRGYRRFYRRRGYRRSYRRFRARRSSIVSSKSRLRVKIPVIANCQITIPANGVHSFMANIFPWLDTVNRNANNMGPIVAEGNAVSIGAVSNPTFQAYANLFDEVKCDGVSTWITCTDAIAPGANYTGLLIGSAIDRSVTNTEQTPTVELAKTSASWWGKVAVNNSIPRIRRSIWASDFQERMNFVDSDYTEDQATGDAWLTAYDKADGNVNFFRPAIRFGLQTVAAPAQAQVANFLVQANFYFTFRNPKGAAAAGGGKSARTLAETVAKLDALPLSAKAAVIDDDDFCLDQQGEIDPAKVE